MPTRGGLNKSPLATAASPAAARRAGPRGRALRWRATRRQRRRPIQQQPARNEAHQEDEQGNEGPADDESRNADVDSAGNAHPVGNDAGNAETERGGGRLNDAFCAIQLQLLARLSSKSTCGRLRNTKTAALRRSRPRLKSRLLPTGLRLAGRMRASCYLAGRVTRLRSMPSFSPLTCSFMKRCMMGLRMK